MGVRESPSKWLWAALLAWLVLIAASVNLLWKYKSTPGAPARAPVEWPEGTRIVRAADRLTLLFFAHPRCTCTRASLDELASLLTQHPRRLSARVVFVRPGGVGEHWIESDTYAMAGSLEGVQRIVDQEGAEARRFGVVTSGTALLYDARGHLLFNGGITGARGHVGDNLGRARLSALVGGGLADRRESPVFGCELEGRGAAP